MKVVYLPISTDLTDLNIIFHSRVRESGDSSSSTSTLIKNSIKIISLKKLQLFWLNVQAANIKENTSI